MSVQYLDYFPRFRLVLFCTSVTHSDLTVYNSCCASAICFGLLSINLALSCLQSSTVGKVLHSSATTNTLAAAATTSSNNAAALITPQERLRRLMQAQLDKECESSHLHRTQSIDFSLLYFICFDRQTRQEG